MIGSRNNMASNKNYAKVPFISIITVVFNNEDYIECCIKSVLAQDYSNFEYIIIDGNSTDETLNIVNKYSDRINKIVSEKDSGIYEAFNKGIKYATGDYIGFLNSDDYYTDNKVLSEISKKLNIEKNHVLFSNIKIIDRKTEKVLRVQNSSRFKPFLFRFGIAPPHPTFFCSKQVYERVGDYSTGYRVSADYEMMVRIIYKNKYRFSHLNKNIVTMRSGGISNHGLMGKINQNIEIIKAAKENNLYTNILFITFKIPYKILEILRKNFA